MYLYFYLIITFLGIYLAEILSHSLHLGFPGGSDGEEFACSAGDTDSILVLGRSPGEGNDNPPTPVLFLGEFHGQRSLVSYSPQGRRVGPN